MLYVCLTQRRDTIHSKHSMSTCFRLRRARNNSTFVLFHQKKNNTAQQHYTLKLYHCVVALIENHFHSRFHLHFHSFSLLCVLLSFLYILVYTLEATDGTTTAHTHGPLRSDGKWFFTEKIISTFRIPSTALFSLQSPPAQNRETIKDSPAPFRWLIDELHRVHFMLLSKILISIHCVCECGEKEVSVLIERLRKSILQPSTSLSFHSSFVVSLRSTVDFYHTCKREAWWRYKFFNSHSSHKLDSHHYQRCGPVWTL